MKKNKLGNVADNLAHLGFLLNLALIIFINPNLGFGVVYIATTAALTSLAYFLWTIVQYQRRKFLLSLLGLATSLVLALMAVIQLILF